MNLSKIRLRLMQHDVRLSPEATDDDIKQRCALARLSTMVTNKMAVIFELA